MATTAAKDEKRENAGNGSYDNAERDGNCGDEWRMLKVLLRGKLMIQEAACAWPVIKHELNPCEKTSEQVDNCIRDRSIASVLHAFVGVVVE